MIIPFTILFGAIGYLYYKSKDELSLVKVEKQDTPSDQIDQDDLYGNSGNTLKMFLEESSDNFEEDSNDEDTDYVFNDEEIVDLEKEYNGNKDNGDNTLITNGNLQQVSKVLSILHVFSSISQLFLTCLLSQHVSHNLSMSFKVVI